MADDAGFWNRVAARYAKRPVRNVAAYEATLAQVREHLSGTDDVLETGCGTGTTALKLAGHVARYAATDLSPAMIDIARAKAIEAGAANLEFHVAPAREGPFAPESFDAVLGFNLLHLVRDLDGAIARAHELLRPGGLYITKTACLREMTPVIRLILPVLRAFGKAPFVHVLGREGLETSIRDGGFDIIEARAFEGARGSWFVVARKI